MRYYMVAISKTSILFHMRKEDVEKQMHNTDQYLRHTAISMI